MLSERNWERNREKPKTFAPEGSAAAAEHNEGDDDNRSGSISNPNHDLLVAASALRTLAYY